ncbi:MAG: tRNA (N(6)-L-threonylcarbamoyladenosine(37)-C(2))-methylthiotransferase MtaB [Alphaproteobacteria bacterium]
MTALDVITFGCRLNAAESEQIRARAEAAGLGDVVIVNTCAVTAEAERQARQAIRRARRERPDAKIIVTGCAAQIDPARFAAMPEVDRVIGNREKLEAATYHGLAADRPAAPQISASQISAPQIPASERLKETAPHLICGFDGRARAFVEIQHGCDHRCTFCIIPFGRGPSRSVPAAGIIAQVQDLVDRGFCEIVLTGVDLDRLWRRDLADAPSLTAPAWTVPAWAAPTGSIVRALLKAVPDLARLRLSSLDPAEVDDDLLRAIVEEDRLMPHIHWSLQAGDDLILKRMKRRHSRAQAIALCDRIRRERPGIAFGADLIAGFPTETDAMFANSLDLVEDCGLTHLHVFPYSARPGTPAARMPQVPMDVRRARAARLRAAGETAFIQFLDGRIGQAERVLVEDGTSARSEHFLPVRLDRAESAGRIVAAVATGRDGKTLICQTAP